MSHRTYLVSLWVRLWHWTNAALILVLTVTGISLHFAAPDRLLVPFSRAAQIHDIAGLMLVALYVFFVVANIVSGHWWQYVPKPHGFLDRCVRQGKFYAFGIFRGDPHPYPPTEAEHFNVLQQITYWSVMYLLMPILLITGIIFLWPELAPKRMFGVDGLLPIAVLHYMVGAVIVAFMIAHIYLGTMGKKASSLFRMMVTGWHEDER